MTSSLMMVQSLYGRAGPNIALGKKKQKRALRSGALIQIATSSNQREALLANVVGAPSCLVRCAQSDIESPFTITAPRVSISCHARNTALRCQRKSQGRRGVGRYGSASAEVHGIHVDGPAPLARGRQRGQLRQHDG